MRVLNLLKIQLVPLWNILLKIIKYRLNETVTNYHGLKMPAKDGKIQLTDVANTEQLLHLI